MLYLQMADDFVGKFGWKYHINNIRKLESRKKFSLEECLQSDPKALLIRQSLFLAEDIEQLYLSKYINTTLIALDHACKMLVSTNTDNLDYNVIFATTCADDDPDLARIMPYVVEETTPQSAIAAWEEFANTAEINGRFADVIRLGAATNARQYITSALYKASYSKTLNKFASHDEHYIEVSNIDLLFWGLEDIMPSIESRLPPFTDHADSSSAAIYNLVGRRDPIAEELIQWGKNWKTAIESNEDQFYDMNGVIDAKEIISRIIKDEPSARKALAVGVPFCDIAV